MTGADGGDQATPLISVVVSTYRRPERCARLLRALADQTLPADRFEVVAVDNGSGDETSDVVKRLVGEVPYRLRPLHLPVNRGPAPARNLGWRSSAAPVVAFTDDDCVPEAGWLEAGLSAMAASPRVGVAQGRTRQPDDVDEAEYDQWNHRQIITAPTPYFEACNIFYRRAALEAGGGFDESIGWWGEDASAGWGTVGAGWQRGFVDGAVVVHDVENRSYRWYVRNGLLETNTIRLAARHPGFRRDAFWRPWSYRREDTAFKCAVVALVVAVKWRPAAVAALPYLWWQRPSLRNVSFFRKGAERVAVDAARSAGQVRGVVRYRILVV